MTMQADDPTLIKNIQITTPMEDSDVIITNEQKIKVAFYDLRRYIEWIK